jgi:hypothetical protein
VAFVFCVVMGFLSGPATGSCPPLAPPGLTTRTTRRVKPSRSPRTTHRTSDRPPTPREPRARADAHNGAHSANGITAIFIATGQDAANVAESSAALVFAEHRPNGDFHYSVTIPSLIVATYGGGTGLATQRECLEVLGCYGAGKVRKLAEIVAATVLCGEISLGSAIVSEEWVKAHDLFGRNRP